MKTKNVLRVGQLANVLDNLRVVQPKEPPERMQTTCIQEVIPNLVAELRAIFVAETGENPWAIPIEAISPIHLAELSQTYIHKVDPFSDFYSLWIAFLASEPEPDQVSKFLEQVNQWGYVLDDDSTSS